MKPCRKLALLLVLAGCVEVAAPVVDTTVDTTVREAEVTGSGSGLPEPLGPVGRKYVGVNVRYVYGSRYATVNCEPSEAICFTARSWGSPHYLWASDSTHMARKVEGILGVENPACGWCGRYPRMRMVSQDFWTKRLDDLSPEDTLTFIELKVSIDPLETSPQLLDSVRGLEISTNQEHIKGVLRRFVDSEYNTDGWEPKYQGVSSWMFDRDSFCTGSRACSFRTIDRSPYFWTDPGSRYSAVASLSVRASPMPETQPGCESTPIPWGPNMWERPDGHYSAVRTITLRVETTTYLGNVDGPFDGDGTDLGDYYQRFLVYDFCPGSA